jgi:hypothetical protein
LLRVVGQTATDFSSVAFPLADVSGLLEVAALALWGIHLMRIMSGKLQANRFAPLQESLKTRSIEPSDVVATVLDHEPRLIEAFMSAGFTQLSSEYARQTIARVVTLRQACQRWGVDERPFIIELNRRRDRVRSFELPLAPAVVAHRCAPQDQATSTNATTIQ